MLSYTIVSFAVSGRISIKYQRDNIPIDGAEIQIYKVDDDVDIQTTDPQEYVQHLSDNAVVTIKTDLNGQCEYTTDTGTYLIVQTNRTGTSKQFELFNPYFVTVPLYENGKAVYNVSTLPKTQPLLNGSFPEKTIPEPFQESSEQEVYVSEISEPITQITERSESTPHIERKPDTVLTGDYFPYYIVSFCVISLILIMITSANRKKD